MLVPLDKETGTKKPVKEYTDQEKSDWEDRLRRQKIEEETRRKK